MGIFKRKQIHSTTEVAEADVLTEHVKMESYARGVAHAVVAQALQEMLSPENMKAITGLVMEQGGNVARQAITEDGRRGSRISAEEAVTGSYDALERKWNEAMERLLPSQKIILGMAAAVVVVLILGLTLALWRFVLFGL